MNKFSSYETTRPQNKRFYAVLVLAVGIVLAALHVADLLCDGCFHRLCQSLRKRYLLLLRALALPYLPARGWLPSP